MKKYTVISILIFQLFISLNLQSQLSYGIKGGINLSNSSHENTDSRIGYHLGLIAHKQYSNNFYLQSGIEFTAKGANRNYLISHYMEPLQPHIHDWKYRLNYLQIPLLIGYKYPLNTSTKILINAGPYLSYGIYARERYIYSYYKWPQYISSYTPTHSTVIKKGFEEPGFHKFDFGVTGGIGIEYRQYLLNVNYESGILNLMTGLYDGDNPSWRNQNFTISVGYFFRK